MFPYLTGTLPSLNASGFMSRPIFQRERESNSLKPRSDYRETRVFNPCLRSNNISVLRNIVSFQHVYRSWPFVVVLPSSTYLDFIFFFFLVNQFHLFLETGQIALSTQVFLHCGMEMLIPCFLIRETTLSDNHQLSENMDPLCC